MNNTEDLMKALNEYQQSSTAQALQEVIINGPHIDPEILISYATEPTYKLGDADFEHMTMCPTCIQEFLMLKRTNRELFGDTVLPKEGKEFNFIEFLKNALSNVRIAVRSLAEYLHEISEPESQSQPVQFVTTTSGVVVTPPTPRRRKTVTKLREIEQFHPGDKVIFGIEIPLDGYLTVFTFSKTQDIQIVFPSREEIHQALEAQDERRIVFKAPQETGTWTVKAVITEDDPFANLDSPHDESWTDQALEHLARYLQDARDDSWWLGSLDLHVK